MDLYFSVFGGERHVRGVQEHFCFAAVKFISESFPLWLSYISLFLLY